MTAAATQQTPVVPPRPSRSAEKDVASNPTPRIPPRPSGRRPERSVSPSADRFAPSPLQQGIIAKGLKGPHLSPFPSHGSSDPIDRAGSVNMPSVGEEGTEYSAVSEELQHEQEVKSRSASPEQTRTVAHDLQLHAPKPSLPAKSAKQRVSAVTRTDSDKAASFGFGRASSDQVPPHDAAKKRTSSIFSNGSDVAQQTEDEHGIPEIGQRVPMNPNLGDVQAPSPGPGATFGTEPTTGRRHHRKHSSRSLPPGSYGLHGHGVTSQDSLDKAYYEKHPDLLEREHHTPIHDRQNDYAMSKTDLNKLVRDTASRASGMGASSEVRGPPTDEAAFKATDEYASRMSSPRPASTAPKPVPSSLNQSFQVQVNDADDNTIHVEDSKHPEMRSYGEPGDDTEKQDGEYQAPILASDEVGKDAGAYLQHPAVHPGPERRGSAYEMEEARSLPTSRPTSRNTTHPPREYDSTPLEDVKEYEPLFGEEAKQANKKPGSPELRRHFPSKDVWEDAPNSVHYTAEVATPDVPEGSRRKSSTHHQNRPITPAQAFALHQEELAEKEAKGQTHSFLPLSEDKPTWVSRQTHLKSERPSNPRRFPSRDVWEDVPESQLQQTELSGSSPTEDAPSEESQLPKQSESAERPVIPARPRPKESGDDSLKKRPSVSDKPKPEIPARPTKSLSGDSKDGEVSKPKPPVPSRPVGGKIAALQAGFMSDLNKRLQIGPQAPKKEEATEEQAAPETTEKVPLSDARKGRARGPQRRAPAKSPAPATSASTSAPKAVSFSFSTPVTAWTIDPEEGSISVAEEDAAVEQKTEAPEVKAEQVAQEVPVEHTKTQEEAKIEEPAIQAAETEEIPAAQAPEPADSKAVPEAEAAEQPVTEEKTLVTNTAGESILQETVAKEGDSVEPVATSEEVKA